MAARIAACSCGALRATVEAEPIRVSICHCLACQRRTGSSYGVQARFPADAVRVEGEYREYVRYSDEDGEERTFCFCPECGATVFYTSPFLAGFIAIPVGAFADPGFPPPTVSVWEARRHPWQPLPETITDHVD